MVFWCIDLNGIRLWLYSHSDHLLNQHSKDAINRCLWLVLFTNNMRWVSELVSITFYCVDLGSAPVIIYIYIRWSRAHKCFSITLWLHVICIIWCHFANREKKCESVNCGVGHDFLVLFINLKLNVFFLVINFTQLKYYYSYLVVAIVTRKKAYTNSKRKKIIFLAWFRWKLFAIWSYIAIKLDSYFHVASSQQISLCVRVENTKERTSNAYTVIIMIIIIISKHWKLSKSEVYSSLTHSIFSVKFVDGVDSVGF